MRDIDFNGKTALSIGFAISLVVANLSASKIAAFDIPLLGMVVMPAGFLGIGVAFLCSDLLSELYGRDAAREAVNASVVGLGLAYGLVYAAVQFPAAPFYELAAAFRAVFGASATIIVASVVTTLVSQHTDVSVFHYLRERTSGRLLFVRNVGSTTVSQFVDTSVFIILAFVVLPPLLGGTTTPLAAILPLIMGQYVVKVVVAALDTPLFYAVVGVRNRVSDVNLTA